MITTATAIQLSIVLACLAFKRTRLVSAFLCLDIFLNVALEQIFVHNGWWKSEHYYSFVIYHTVINFILLMGLYLIAFKVSRETLRFLAVAFLIIFTFNIISVFDPLARPVGMRIAMFLQALAILAEHIDHGRVVRNNPKRYGDISFLRRFNSSKS